MAEETIKEEPVISFTVSQIKEMYAKAAQIGADEGVKAYIKKSREERTEKADRRLRNTKLLLRNFRMLKENADNSIFGRTQMEESAADILDSMMNVYDDNVIVEAIQRSATRTAIIVAHVETMIGLYQLYCEKSGNDIEKRRFEVVYDVYIADEPMPVAAVAKARNMSKENVYADLKVAIERLTALIFGVDGLKAR